jgi:hypothetical protein
MTFLECAGGNLAEAGIKPEGATCNDGVLDGEY